MHGVLKYEVKFQLNFSSSVDILGVLKILISPVLSFFLMLLLWIKK